MELPFDPWLLVPLSVGAMALSGVLNGASPLRRAAALGVASITFVTPHLPPEEEHLLRFVLAAGTLVALVRAIELSRDTRGWGPLRRAWHMVAVFDTRRAAVTRPGLDRSAIVRATLFSLPAGLTAWLLPQVETVALRWLFGAVFVYTSFEVTCAVIAGSYRVLGVAVPSLHADPILSRTVAEFWGSRWNLTVRGMLREHCFLPLARRGRPRLGLFVAFVASAVIHFWITLAPLDVFWASVMALFFLAQGLLVLLERRLRVAAWRPALQRLFTLGAIGLTLPLFVEPFVRAFFDP